MREFLVRKDWVNLLAVLSLAVIPVVMTMANGTLQPSAQKKSASIQVAELSAE